MLRDIIKSFGHSLQALPYLFKPWVFKYLFISGIISLVCFALFISGAYYFGDDLADGIVGLFTNSIKYEWIKTAIQWLTRLLLFAGIIFTLKYLILIVTSPLMSALSEKLENKLTGRTLPKLSFGSHVKGLSRGINLSISNLLRELIFIFVLSILSFIPGMAFITSILFFIVGAYYVGFGNLDFYMERRYNAKQARQFIKRNKGLAIGNGTVFLGLLLLIFIGAFIAPTICTISATLSGLERIEDNY